MTDRQLIALMAAVVAGPDLGRTPCNGSTPEYVSTARALLAEVDRTEPCVINGCPNLARLPTSNRCEAHRLPTSNR